MIEMFTDFFHLSAEFTFDFEPACRVVNNAVCFSTKITQDSVCLLSEDLRIYEDV